MVQVLGPCPNGAQPTPQFASASLLIRVAAIGAGAIEAIAQLWPLAVATEILAQMPATAVCDTNAVDPGDLTVDILKADLTAAFLPGINSQSGTLGWWIWNKALYAAFSQACECKGGVGVIPTPIAPVYPTGGAPYPTAHSEQPQLTRIENNQSTANDALQQLYNGIQRTGAFASDLRVRSVQTDLGVLRGTPFSMVGEGSHPLGPQTWGSSYQSQDVLGVEVQLSSLPTKYKVRGTLTPRYYGIGHVTFNADTGTGLGPFITLRHALHYQREFVSAPQDSQQFEFRWALQPGAIATGTQIFRSVDFPGYSDYHAGTDAYAQIGDGYMPAGWVDPPLYPAAAATGRVFALGGIP